MVKPEEMMIQGILSSASVAFYFKDAELQLCWQSQDAHLIFAFLMFNKLPLFNFNECWLHRHAYSMFLKPKFEIFLVPSPLLVCKLAKFICKLVCNFQPSVQSKIVMIWNLLKEAFLRSSNILVTGKYGQFFHCFKLMRIK